MTVRLAAEIAFANGALGKPWENKARGPDAFDCWGLVLYARRTLFGDDLPEMPETGLSWSETRRIFTETVTPLGWKVSQRPRDGAVAIFGRSDMPHHAGIFLAIPPGPGRVLHADQDYGVLFETTTHLSGRGWSKVHWFVKD